MKTAMKAGNVKGIQNVLSKKFLGLKFGIADTEVEEVDKPTEVSATATPVTEVVGAEDKEETTGTLYGDYMAGLPGGVRELVTTDYKGVRGGRLGRGNYTTASIIPGAQVQTPTRAPAPAPAPAPSTGGGVTTTYNAPVIGGDWQQFNVAPSSGDVNYGTIGTTARAPTSAPRPKAAAQPAGGGFTPAWAKASSQKATTAKKAGAGKVASTTSRGTYVAPSSAAAPATAQRAAAAVSQAISQGGGGIKAAAKAGGDPGRIGANAAAALVSEGGRSSAKEALEKAEKGKIELTNQARKALEKAADKKKKKKK
jgi:hypothetical protein